MEAVCMLQESNKLGVISLSLQSECNAVYYCQISRSQKMLQLPLVASLEIHANLHFKIFDIGEFGRVSDGDSVHVPRVEPSVNSVYLNSWSPFFS